jgi:hypothetical protein
MTNNRAKSADNCRRLFFSKKPHKPTFKTQSDREKEAAFAKLDGIFLNRLSKQADHLSNEKKRPKKGSALGNPRIIRVLRRLKNANENHPIRAGIPPSASQAGAR